MIHPSLLTKGGSIEKNNYLLSEKVKEKNNLIEKCNSDSQKISAEGDEGIMDEIMSETESIDDTKNSIKKSDKSATHKTSNIANTKIQRAIPKILLRSPIRALPTKHPT